MTSPNLGGLDRFASEPERVDKPWGHELIWSRTDHYAGKILFVRAGESLSLQFHRVKDEAWYVQAGRAKIELGDAGEAVLNEELSEARWIDPAELADLSTTPGLAEIVAEAFDRLAEAGDTQTASQRLV